MQSEEGKGLVIHNRIMPNNLLTAGKLAAESEVVGLAAAAG